MSNIRLSTAFVLVCTLATFQAIPASCLAEEQPAAVIEAVPPVAPSGHGFDAPREHHFFDRKNRVLFVVSAAFSTADFAVTRANLQNGGKELNPLVRPFANSTAGLALNFAGQSAGTLGLSYFLHKTGHHRLERIAPILNIGGSAVAVAYSATHH